MGGRGGQDGPGVDHHVVLGPPGRCQAPGGLGRGAPPAPRGRGLAPRRHRRGPGRAIASARRHRTEASMARDEEMLVSQAAQMGFEDSTGPCPIGSSWPTPTGPHRRTRAQEPPRRLLEASFSGMWLGQMTLDPVSAPSWPGAQPPRARPLRGRLRRGQGAPGRTARIDELARTSAQRRADALVEMAARSATAPADGIRPVPLFSVFVGYETVHGRICELENGTVIAPSALAR